GGTLAQAYLAAVAAVLAASVADCRTFVAGCGVRPRRNNSNPRAARPASNSGNQPNPARRGSSATGADSGKCSRCMGSLSPVSVTGSFQCCTEAGSGLFAEVPGGTATGPEVSSFDKPGGAAAAISDFSLNKAFASPEEFKPCAAALFAKTPKAKGAVNDRSFVADAPLTPPALATRSPTASLRPPKMVTSSWEPTLSMLLVATPPPNSDRALSATAPKPPSRIRPARVLAPSGDEAKFVSPLRTVDTALFSVCRVAASGSPTRVLALRTTSGVKLPFTASMRVPDLRNWDTAMGPPIF